MASRSPHFFFQRGYMDYHADRFHDHSLIFAIDGLWVGVLPANLDVSGLWSHQGLTYGGILADRRMDQSTMLLVFEAIQAYMRTAGIRQLTYKALPSVYFHSRSEDDLYALFRMGAILVRREAASVLTMDDPRRRYSKGKKHSLSLSRRAGVIVEPSGDWPAFMDLLATVLRERHHATPTHTTLEIQRLATLFPDNIRLYIARINAELLAGAMVFVNETVVHTQYLASSESGRQVGALDAVVDYLITDQFASKRHLSFGVSTEQGGSILNEGLIRSKEGFGARTLVHDTYKLTI